MPGTPHPPSSFGTSLLLLGLEEEVPAARAVSSPSLPKQTAVSWSRSCQEVTEELVEEEVTDDASSSSQMSQFLSKNSHESVCPWPLVVLSVTTRQCTATLSCQV